MISSVFTPLFSLHPETVKDYARDSGKYAVSSLFCFPPDPFPLIVLISALFTTVNTFRGVLKGRLLHARQWILLVGAWSGHHAMMKLRLREELRKTVESLSQQLDRTGEQIAKWNELTRQEEGKIGEIRDVSEGLKGLAQGFQGIAQTFTTVITLQKEVSREYIQLTAEMSKGGQDLLKALQEHEERMKKIEGGLDERLRLIQEHQEVQRRNIGHLEEIFKRIMQYDRKRNAKDQ